MMLLHVLLQAVTTAACSAAGRSLQTTAATTAQAMQLRQTSAGQLYAWKRWSRTR
jgi:hypothetical protein